MSIEFFKERENIVVEGEAGDKFYILHTGKATVFKGVKSEIGTTILVSVGLYLIYSAEWLTWVRAIRLVSWHCNKMHQELRPLPQLLILG